MLFGYGIGTGPAGGGGGLKQTSGNAVPDPPLPLWKSPLEFANTVQPIGTRVSHQTGGGLIQLNGASFDAVWAGRMAQHVCAGQQHLAGSRQRDARLSTLEDQLLLRRHNCSFTVCVDVDDNAAALLLRRLIGVAQTTDDNRPTAVTILEH